jgi:hypothetical protein
VRKVWTELLRNATSGGTSLLTTTTTMTTTASHARHNLPATPPSTPMRRAIVPPSPVPLPLPLTPSLTDSPAAGDTSLASAVTTSTSALSASGVGGARRACVLRNCTGGTVQYAAVRAPRYGVFVLCAGVCRRLGANADSAHSRARIRCRRWQTCTTRRCSSPTSTRPTTTRRRRPPSLLLTLMTPCT